MVERNRSHEIHYTGLWTIKYMLKKKKKKKSETREREREKRTEERMMREL